MTYNLPAPILEEAREPAEQPKDRTSGLIRIEDDQGHLLFCFNPSTKCIEILGANRGGSRSTRKKLYSVSVLALQDCGLRIAIGVQPNKVIQAELVGEREN